MQFKHFLILICFFVFMGYQNAGAKPAGYKIALQNDHIYLEGIFSFDDADKLSLNMVAQNIKYIEKTWKRGKDDEKVNMEKKYGCKEVSLENFKDIETATMGGSRWLRYKSEVIPCQDIEVYAEVDFKDTPSNPFDKLLVVRFYTRSKANPKNAMSEQENEKEDIKATGANLFYIHDNTLQKLEKFEGHPTY